MEMRRIELRTSRMRSEHSTTELHPLKHYVAKGQALQLVIYEYMNELVIYAGNMLEKNLTNLSSIA